MEKRQSLPQWCWENWTATCKRLKLEHFFTPYTNINSKWIKDLKISTDSINLLEENIGQALYNINHRNIFSKPLPRVMTVKTKLNKWDLIKLKSFCTAKETLHKMKTQPTQWEKIFANEWTDKGTITKIYKHLQLNTKKTNNPIKNKAENLNNYPKKTYRWSKHMKRCLTSLIIREMQIKTSMRYHLTMARMAIIKSLQTIHAGEGVEQREPYYTVGGNVNCCSHYGKQYGDSSEPLIQNYHLIQ